MTPTITVSVWLVFGVALPSNASQMVTAIPFASFESCERNMMRALDEIIRGEQEFGPNRRPITIKPYCTTVVPLFWITKWEF